MDKDRIIEVARNFMNEQTQHFNLITHKGELDFRFNESERKIIQDLINLVEVYDQINNRANERATFYSEQVKDQTKLANNITNELFERLKKYHEIFN